MVEFAVRNLRVAPKDWLEMLIDDEWRSGQLTIHPNPEGPQFEVAADQRHQITEDARLRACTDGPLAPLKLLAPRSQFVHPRCLAHGIHFMLDGKSLMDKEPVEIELDGEWHEGFVRLPPHPEQALRCDMADQWPAFITCHTQVRHKQ